jgi:carbon-monoxide dehydrogenase large subunit
VQHVEMGGSRDGTIQAFRLNVLQDAGAYPAIGAVLPFMTRMMASGVYDIPKVECNAKSIVTTTASTVAYRGAGRPEATAAIERAMDLFAAEIGKDPAEVRRINLIPPFSEPHTTVVGQTYDVGDYVGSLDRVLEAAGYEQLRADQAARRQSGDTVQLGIGVSIYVEITGGVGNGENAKIEVHDDGTATIYTGTSPHGQGLETSFAQIVADRLGVDPDVVDVIHGDTNTGPFGKNTYGSRTMSVGGEAIARAAEKVQDKAKRIVAHQLEAAPEDIEVAEGRFRVVGSPDKAMTLADVATEAYIPQDLPEGMEAGLDEISFYDPSNFVWPFGAHACITEVDVETGRVDIIRYVAVDDCGRAINPLLIDGQVHGGVVHALGQALYEQVVYDENGQLVTGTFVDYALPSAADVPSFETDRTETPSPTNTLGVKGVAEAPTIACTPAVVSSVLDALAPLGVKELDMPLTPMRVWNAIQEAKGGAS